MNHDEEILAKVYRRGRALRRRRRVAQTLSSALVLSLAGGGMVFALSGAPRQKQALPAHEPTVSDTATAKPKPPESPKPKPTSSETPKPKPTTETKESPKAEPKPTSDPAPECFNSTNPECGEFSWKTKPSNSWMEAGVDGPPALLVGQQGGWMLTAADADAKVVWYGVMWGDGGYTFPSDKPACVKGYGSWSLPPKASGSLEKWLTHTFEAPGTYTIKFKVMSRDNRQVDGKYLCQQAYGEYKYLERTVVVTQPESPSPDPTTSPV